MARKSLPDHEGRMPNHPRYGNPSDPTEEGARIEQAHQNLIDWQRKAGAEFSGGVSMSYGDGRVYDVSVGQREIADKIISSRPLPLRSDLKALPESAEAAPEPPPIQLPPPQLWLWRLINRIKGAFQWKT